MPGGPATACALRSERANGMRTIASIEDIQRRVTAGNCSRGEQAPLRPMGAAFFGPGRGRTPGKTFSSPTEYIRATHRQGSHWSTLESHKLHLSRSKLELERLPCRRLGMFAETSAVCCFCNVRCIAHSIKPHGSLATCRAQPAALRPIQASATFLVKGQNVLDRMQCPLNAVKVLSHCQTQGPPYRICQYCE